MVDRGDHGSGVDATPFSGESIMTPSKGTQLGRHEPTMCEMAREVPLRGAFSGAGGKRPASDPPQPPQPQPQPHPHPQSRTRCLKTRGARRLKLPRLRRRRQAVGRRQEGVC